MTISLLNVYLSKTVPQNLLLTEREFERYARNRGLQIRQEDLEYFEELRLLFPLCRLKLPVVEEYYEKDEVRRRYAPLFNISHNLLKWYENGLCEDPTETDFRPWKEYRDGHYKTARAIYHPWQFMNLRVIVKWLYYRIQVPDVIDENRLAEISQGCKKFWVSKKNWIKFVSDRIQRDLQFLPLLLSIEDVYLPQIRSSFIGVPEKPDGGFEVWRSLRANFSPEKVLKGFGFTIKQIKDWREQIAVEARRLDPLRNWYLLVRYAAYHKRKKLAGDALFAQDCYEIVEVLGRFLEELTGERQYGPDDLLNGRRGEWKKSVYGAEVDFVNRDVLKKIIYEYSLDYDYKVLLFVEGDTEFEAVPIIARALGIPFASLGIRLEKLGGYTELSLRRIEKLLQYAKKDGLKAYIIVDNHPDVKKYVENLIIRDDLPVEGDKVCIWDIDFEEDNFTIDELIEAAKRVATKDKASISLTAEMIKEKRKREPKKGIGDMLIDLCREQTYTLSKAKLGEELGHMIAERIRRGEKETTKIEKELLKVAALARY